MSSIESLLSPTRPGQAFDRKFRKITKDGVVSWTLGLSFCSFTAKRLDTQIWAEKILDRTFQALSIDIKLNEIKLKCIDFFSGYRSRYPLRMNLFTSKSFICGFPLPFPFGLTWPSSKPWSASVKQFTSTRWPPSTPLPNIRPRRSTLLPSSIR